MSTEQRPATAPQTVRVSHRYPWSGEERTVIAVLLVVPVAITVWQWLGPGPSVAATLPAFVIGWGAAAALFRLGHSRKQRSSTSAELTGTRLRVTGGRVKASQGDLRGVRAVETQEIGPETVLIATCADGTALRIPTRLSPHPDLAPVLREHLLHPDVDLTAEARALLSA